ncbi:MAG: universal stress protein [Acidimicrobiales bacterium]
MSDPRVLLCTDGSELSVKALAVGVALLGPGARVSVATVADTPDATLLTGSGFAGGVISSEEFDRESEAATESARSIVAGTIAALGLTGADPRVAGGEPGPAICRLASELAADAIVIGSRGRGGLKRAVLGSVSDHVVRHAPCPVLVTRETAVTSG